MTASKRDIAIFLCLSVAMILAIRYFYKGMSDERSVSATDPYTLIAPTPQAVLAINRPHSFSKVMLPTPNIRKVFAQHIPEAYLSLIEENPDLSSFLIAYYPQGEILFAPADQEMAKRLLKQWDAAFPFPAQRLEGYAIPMYYYPDTDKRFLGCYYHNGLFVASYQRKLLLLTAERERAKATVLPEIQKAIAKSESSTIDLFLPGQSLDLHIQSGDTLSWSLPPQWLALDLFFSDGSLCCLNEQPYEERLDTAGFYQSLRDTIRNKVGRLFPDVKTTAQVSHDEAVVYYAICVN